MLLTEPKNSKIVKPNLKLIDVKKLSKSGANYQGLFEITLGSDAIAPFVVLDFKQNSGIRAQFLENGFFVFDGKKTIQMETNSQTLTEQQIKDNLTFKTLTDVV